MKSHQRSLISMLTAAAIMICAGPITQSARGWQKETKMSKRASGTFEVKLTPQDDKSAEGLGRMTIAKQLHGDLEGTSAGQMLTAITKVEGSAAYVAVERIEGTLHGRRGTFMLHHLGMISRGVQQLMISVVPDSGTDQLSGISGTMSIEIENGKHFYEFDYTLPAGP